MAPNSTAAEGSLLRCVFVACASPGGGQPLGARADGETAARRAAANVDAAPRTTRVAATDAPATRSAPEDAGTAALAPPSVTETAVTTEVRGRLVWREPRYRLLVKGSAKRPAGHEVVLDLWISENKVLGRRLEALRDKDVIITGPVVPVPKGSVITADTDYTSGFRDFEILSEVDLHARRAPAIRN